MAQQLQLADVDNLRCAFVHQINQYHLCKKYAVTCCLDEAKESYRKYTLSSSACTLSKEVVCGLKNNLETSKAVSCSLSVPCSGQAAIETKQTTRGPLYSPSIIDDTLSGSYPLQSSYVNLYTQDNSLYIKGKIKVGIIDEAFTTINSVDFLTGSALIGSSVVTSPEYEMRAQIKFGLAAWGDTSTAYVKKIRLYKTDSLGNFVPLNFVDVDVSPTTSPYLTCGSCTAVTPTHLYVNNANWATAIKTVVDNAVREISGLVNISFSASKSVNIPPSLSFDTLAKHSPNSEWWGLYQNDFRFEYFDGTNTTTQTGSIFVEKIHALYGNIYGTQLFTLSCGTKTITVPNTLIVAQLDKAQTNFTNIKLVSDKSEDTVTITPFTPLNCQYTTLTAIVTSSYSTTLVEWINPSAVVIGTGSTYNHTSVLPPGNYSCRVTLASGCILIKSFTI